MTLVAIWLSIPQCMHLSGTVMEIWCLKDNGVSTLTFWGHMTSSVMWPFDSWRSTSHGWSIVTMRLSGTITEIWHLKDNGVTTLTFWVRWRHQSRDHSTPGVDFYGWTIVTLHLSSTVMEIWPFEVLPGRLFLSLIHIWRCRRIERCRSRWSPYH